MITPRYYPFLGGLEKQSHTLSKELSRLGLEVSVVTGNNYSKLPRTENIEGVMIHRLCSSKLSWLRGFSFVPLLIRFLISNAHRFDVVHLHTFGWYLLGVIPIAKMLKLPTLLKIPNVGDFGLPGIRKRLFGNILLKLVTSADAFVSMDKKITEELVAEGISSNRIFRTSNGIDTSVYHPPSSEEQKTKTRKKLNLPKGRLCLFTGRLTPQKGLIDLFAAWPEILKKVPSAHLILCGSGTQEQELRNLSRSYRIDKNIHFKGSVNNIASYYRISDLFILPSYAEGNSNSLLEAMACGLPVVSTLTGGNLLLVGDVGKDYLVKPGDRLALINVLLKLLTSESTMKKLRVGFTARIKSNFSIKKIAIQYVNCYKLLASKQFNEIGL